MKITKQILEAINRGINLALDDYDDEDIISQKVSQINDNSSTLSSILSRKLIEISKIPIVNSIEIDKETKRQISKLYKEIVNICAAHHVKCIVYESDDLKQFLRRIVPLYPKANLNWIDTSKLTSMTYMFDQFLSKDFHGDISQWDVSNITNMYHMFYRCEKFNCDISGWDVHNVIKMDGMFSECYNFNQPIGSWDVHNVDNMAYMFSGCKKFNQDLSKWDVSNVTNMDWMFSRCKKLNQDFSMWDVSNVKSHNGFSYDADFAKYPGQGKSPHWPDIKYYEDKKSNTPAYIR